MATNMKCPIPDCEFTTGEHSEAVALAYFNAHLITHQQSVAQPAASSSAKRNEPKLTPPKVDIGVSMEEWNMFERRWSIYKQGSHLSEEDVSHHLFQCADAALGDALLKTDPVLLTTCV